MNGGEPSTPARRPASCTSMFLFRPSACLECDEAEPDEALECAVCLSLFIEPIIFPGCSHSFCRLCLLRLQMHAAFRCPLCRCHSQLTVTELTKWPVARELRSRAKAAAPALYETRSHDHKQRITSLLHEHAVKRLQDKCPYREHMPLRFSRTYAPPRFTPGTDCLDAVIRCCLGRRWCAGLQSHAARVIGFGRARWAKETPGQYAVASGCALPSPRSSVTERRRLGFRLYGSRVAWWLSRRGTQPSTASLLCTGWGGTSSSPSATCERGIQWVSRALQNIPPFQSLSVHIHASSEPPFSRQRESQSQAAVCSRVYSPPDSDTVYRVCRCVLMKFCVRVPSVYL